MERLQDTLTFQTGRENRETIQQIKEVEDHQLPLCLPVYWLAEILTYSISLRNILDVLDWTEKYIIKHKYVCVCVCER